MNKPKTYLLTGGVRSGKSSYSLKLAENSRRPFYIATGWAGDDEMSDRIVKHKEERDSRWNTIEERFDLKKALQEAVSMGSDTIVIDCITMWMCNLMYQERTEISRRLSDLQEFLSDTQIPVIMVTNEVGLGIVPESKDGRDFRDELGRINQQLAQTADKVIFMVSGIPMEIK